MISGVIDSQSLAHGFRAIGLSEDPAHGGGFGGIFADNYFREPLANDLTGRVEPLALDVVRGGSLLDASANRFVRYRFSPYISATFIEITSFSNGNSLKKSSQAAIVLTLSPTLRESNHILCIFSRRGEGRRTIKSIELLLIL